MILEDQLRTEMARVPAQVPPGLARTAYQRYRRRRTVTRAIVSACAAAVVVIGGVVAGAGVVARPAGTGQTGAGQTGTGQTGAGQTGTGQTGTGSAETAAVVKRVTQALGTVSPNAVIYTRNTFRPASAALSPVEQWIAGGETRSEEFTLSGAPMWDNQTTFTPGRVTSVMVNYQTRTWYKSAHTVPQVNYPMSPATSYSCANVDINTITWSAPAIAAQIRTEQACGMLKVAGHASVDGIYTVELTGTQTQITETYWIDQATYLPVRTETNWGPSSSISIIDIRWLPPTAANLTLTTAPIPATFKRVPPPAQP
jgi:hypothetical protein